MIWIVIALCLLVSFIFSGIEAGILSVNRVRLKHRVKLRDRAALILELLLERPERLLITVLVVTNLMNIFAITLAASELIARFGNRGYWITLIAFLPVYLLGVELLPKSLFRKFPYRALAMLAGPQRFADHLHAPLHFVSESVTKLFRGNEGQSRKLFVAREDFKYLTIQIERAGSLTPVERQMILGVVDFRNVTARDVMVPLAEVKSIPGNADIADLITRARQTGIDRWPVLSESGAFSGIVTLLDVALSGRRSGPVSGVQRRIVKLAPNEPAYTVLQKLRAARSGVGTVLEEGQPLGIVTWERVILRLVKSAAA
jgi:CBS domain containing-hemolysin-like protein